MDFFIPSSYKPGKKNSPKWFNSQCAIKLCGIKAIATNNGSSFKLHNLELYPFQPDWISLLWYIAKIASQTFCYSSFPHLKNKSGSSSCTPPSKANLLHLSLLPIRTTKNPKLFSILLPPSQCHLLHSLHARLVKPLCSSTPLNLKVLMVYQL